MIYAPIGRHLIRPGSKNITTMENMLGGQISTGLQQKGLTIVGQGCTITLGEMKLLIKAPKPEKKKLKGEAQEEQERSWARNY